MDRRGESMSAYLLVSGAQTALRFRVPDMGALKLGSGLGCDIQVREPGVRELHCELFLGPLLSARPAAPDVARVDPSGEREHPLDVGETVELQAGERLRIGPVDVEVGARGLPLEEGPRIWDLPTLRARVHSARGLLLRVHGDLDDAARSRLGATDVLTALDDGELAVFLEGAQPHDGPTFVAGSTLELLGLALVETDTDLDSALDAAIDTSVQSGTRAIRSPAPAMQSLERIVAQAAHGDDPVLVLGETGAGKDVLVADLHQRSGRRRQPLVRVAAVELPEDEPGAWLEQRALGGTVVIDEVSALSAKAQSSLTRDLERPLSFRVIATSNQPLDLLVEQRTFRKDLFFRLARFRLDVPSLRERKEDIPVFAASFAKDLGYEGEFSLAVLDLLDGYAWPGNVRELESVIRRALLAAQDETLRVEHLPPELQGGAPRPAAPAADQEMTLDSDGQLSLRDEMAALERRRILEALERHPTQTEAAKALGIPLRTFLNRMDALGIPRARKK